MLQAPALSLLHVRLNSLYPERGCPLDPQQLCLPAPHGGCSKAWQIRLHSIFGIARSMASSESFMGAHKLCAPDFGALKFGALKLTALVLKSFGAGKPAPPPPPAYQAAGNDRLLTERHMVTFMSLRVDPETSPFKLGPSRRPCKETSLGDEVESLGASWSASGGESC
jgi:hypothetical protein